MTEGIVHSDVERRSLANESLRCAWPSGRKGAHPVKECIRPIKLLSGTAGFPKAKEYQKIKSQQAMVEEECSDQNCLEESSDDTL
jgi:hypothetical protein